MNLKADIRYKSNKTGLPIVVILHGFGSTSASFIAATKLRFAENNLFALFVEMRGLGSSDGNPDCSARDIHDIIDAVEYVKTNYAAYVDTTQIHFIGYSGGGGNGLAAACKFPDYFNSITSYFGISDYGHDATDGWYQNGAAAGQKTTLETWIGGNPTNKQEEYHARAAVLGINNYQGYLNLFHDNDDTSVPVVNAQNIIDAAPTHCFSSLTSVSSIVRWLHGYPNSTGVVGLEYSESKVIVPIVNKTYPELTIGTSGTLTVLGYCKTKRFSIWLGGLTEAAAGAGLNEVATVVYNTITGEYQVTPLTGNMDVFIKQGVLTASQSITGVTTLTVV